MSTTTETQRLYYGFSKDELAYPSRIDRDRWDNYVITISNGTELREHCRAIAEAENANADCIEHALGELFSWLSDGDHEEVGTVEEEGWYEPPRYNYADPAAACDADKSLRLLIAVTVLIAPYINMETVLNVIRGIFKGNEGDHKEERTCGNELFL